MNHLRSVLGMVTGSAPAKNDAVDEEKEMEPVASEPTEMEMKENEAKLANPSPSLEATEMTNQPQKETAPEDDDGSLSSLSFYEDFPTLYFAVRKGRYVNNSVFLSWDSARKHIVDYPEAEYIATPTLEQAHQYTNRWGEFDTHDDAATELETETIESSPAKKPRPKSKAKPKQNDSPKLTLRSLILKFYLQKKNKKGGIIGNFLKEHNLDHKIDIFGKHWQKSGLMIMCSDKKPMEEAEAKYDRWIKEQEKKKAKKKKAKASRKRKLSEANDDNGKLDPSSAKANEKKAATNKSKKQKTIPTPSTTVETGGTKKKATPKPGAAATKEKRKSPPKQSSQKRAVEKEQIWNEKYGKLKAFHAKYGHAQVAPSYDLKLYGFAAYTRRRMYRKNLRTEGCPLSVRQIKLLNDIDFDPLYKKVFKQFEKFIGKRVAKLFSVTVKNANGKPIGKAVPFFGTVICISDVQKKYLLVEYDDGDSEDYDMAWLKKGVELYREHKRRDGRRVSSDSTPKTMTASKKGPSKNDDTKGTASNGSKRTTTAAGAKGKPAAPRLTTWYPSRNLNCGIKKAAALAPAVSKAATPKRVNDTIDFEEIEKTANEILGTTTNSQEAIVTPETNQNGNAEKERRNSDHSSIPNINLNGTGNGAPAQDNNGNESDSSDEVEIVEVRVPYRPNPNLFILPDRPLSMVNHANDVINNDVVNNDVMNAVLNSNIRNTIRNTMNNNGNNYNGNNPYSMFQEGFYDF